MKTWNLKESAKKCYLGQQNYIRQKIRLKNPNMIFFSFLFVYGYGRCKKSWSYKFIYKAHSIDTKSWYSYRSNKRKSLYVSQNMGWGYPTPIDRNQRRVRNFKILIFFVCMILVILPFYLFDICILVFLCFAQFKHCKIRNSFAKMK